ncbi:MAG TPA: 1-acyl-sn-glycerol-3-phosphate acyltransferase [Coleofasciculaceae cyanobacterium]|jgi:1-acyl-sn-glycerol-3-phosphate acyltransferase
MIQLASREQVQVMTTSPEHPPEISTAAKVAPVTSRVCNWLTSILYPLGSHLVMPLFFGRIKVTGQENIPKTGAVILAPTHRSRWDALMLPYAAGKSVTGRDLRFMVSEDEIKGLQGWFIRRMGGFPVNTRQPGIGSIRHSVELLRNGEVLVIFPEGNIFRSSQVQPLKPGMARIALQAAASKSSSGLVIVPISISYSEPVPHWGCDATVTIGSPIKVANYCTKSAKKGAQQLTHDLETALREVNEESELADVQPVPTP